MSLHNDINSASTSAATAVCTHRVIHERDFLDRFTPKRNHLNLDASFDMGDGGCLFETSGKELAFVLAQNPRAVWTLVDSDEGEVLLTSGLHLVNRIGYVVTHELVEPRAAYTVILD